MPDSHPRPPDLALSCPAPLQDEAHILMAHGGGGRLMHRLIEGCFAQAFRNPALDLKHDGAFLPLPSGARLAFTTDSYVVRPLFFPGGDIGSLAVNGTVNDLAMCAARPLALSAGFILEEGFATDDLRRIVASMQSAAAAVAVPIVTGDTKVVERGKGDGVFINTAGVGLVAEGVDIAPTHVRAGDAVLLSGDIGRHGVAVLAAREGLAFETTVASDCAPLVEPVFALIEAGVAPHCLRDLTRGGLASALVEIAESARVAIEIEEPAVAVAEAVGAACEILGFDPFYLANEGRFVAFVPPEGAARAVERLRALPGCQQASLVGHVRETGPAAVTVRTRYGGRRVLDMLSGEQLPRIC
jgi:hydrogenase expression/formation protein HypE